MDVQSRRETKRTAHEWLPFSPVQTQQPNLYKTTLRAGQHAEKPIGNFSDVAPHVYKKLSVNDWDHIVPILANPHRLPISFWAQSKVLVLLTSKALHGLEPTILQNHLLSYEPAQPLQLSLDLLLGAFGGRGHPKKRVYSAVAPVILELSPHGDWSISLCCYLSKRTPLWQRTFLFHLVFLQWSFLPSLYFNNFYVF